MKEIVFFDLEVKEGKNTVGDCGATTNDGRLFHDTKTSKLIDFISQYKYLAGHNIFNHDLHYLKDLNQKKHEFIDTLLLSPLLFPQKPYHALGKEEKFDNEVNNPVNDSIKSLQLFEDELVAFNKLDNNVKDIYYFLLKNHPFFSGFFSYIGYRKFFIDGLGLIKKVYQGEICDHADIKGFVSKTPVELAYALSIIKYLGDSITPPWVLKNYPRVENILHKLRSTPCMKECVYCSEKYNEVKALENYFKYPSFRKYNGQDLQHQAVKSALRNDSILAVFPTGGGKSITFQVPALMQGESESGLTVVISPLQSLMKDQVDNLEEKGITKAVTINGTLDPIDRSNSIERVTDGSASLLYISPESLRSATIENILLKRNVVRFVIDEAHCFSSWGHDFRVDYQYIGDFIKSLQEKKDNNKNIPVSCFTATAKPQVIEDIKAYFLDKLGITLTPLIADSERTNLSYHVFKQDSDKQKFDNLRLLLKDNNKPTIIYVSTTKLAEDIANRLTSEGYPATYYHSKLEKSEKAVKQNMFMNDEVKIIVATTAFGMGVDKSDVSTVIHYEISNSLENYVQEAGRAGRTQELKADCYILYNEEDLNQHFQMLNQTKLTQKEISQIWQGIKELTKFRSSISNSAVEIAKAAGWEEGLDKIETKVKTAINALENAGFIKREQNQPRVFADALTVKSVIEANKLIDDNDIIFGDKKELAKRTVQRLVSIKYTYSKDETESRIDVLADQLGVEVDDMVRVVTMLREARILEQYRDLRAHLNSEETERKPLDHLAKFRKIELYLMNKLSLEDKVYNLKEFAEELRLENKRITINDIKVILNYLDITNIINKKSLKGLYSLSFKDTLENVRVSHEKRYNIAVSIIEYLYNNREKTFEKENIVRFSYDDIEKHLEQSLIQEKFDYKTIDDVLLFLKKTESIVVVGTFLVLYNAMHIKRVVLDNQVKYKKSDYKKLEEHYEMRKQQIHIVGEYAERMIKDYKEALTFVNDYFTMNYDLFLNKYFRGRRTEINRTLTRTKFNQLFGAMSPAQLKIITDNTSKNIVVAAGPGSGKTRVLVHKLASLLLMEDVKHEQLLMLTFSRSAVVEFKKRLLTLIGKGAHFVQISTFHSYCFDLLEKVGNLEKSKDIIKDAVEMIGNNEVDLSRITKTVLVIDEAQDMSEDEYNLVLALMMRNEDMRVIAVGDDDQNIYEFRGSDSKYLEKFITDHNAQKYELLENYRSTNNLVQFSNQFLKRINHRLKQNDVISVNQNSGIIKLLLYPNSKYLATPTVSQIISEGLKGSTAVLTFNNEDALNINALLQKSGIKSRILQSTDGFKLHQLEEFYVLLDYLKKENQEYITPDLFLEAIEYINKTFKDSKNLEPVLYLLKDFTDTNSHIYYYELRNFIYESDYQDLYKHLEKDITISTIHQAKGREFDNVVLVLGNLGALKQDQLRTLYVGLTRAKKNLFIHDNSNLFKYQSVDSYGIYMDDKTYDMPDEIIVSTGLKDVKLGYSTFIQNRISDLYAGIELTLSEEGVAFDNKDVVRFSKAMQDQINQFKDKDYELDQAIVKNIVYWFNKEDGKNYRIVLPELSFKKKEKPEEY